jgi:uncharacterized protein
VTTPVAPSGVGSRVGPYAVLGAILAWTWAFWLTAAARGPLDEDLLTVVLFALGGLGPAVVTVVVVRRRAPAERRAFVRRVLDPRLAPPWVWLAVLAVGAGPAVAGWLVDRALWDTATGGLGDDVAAAGAAGVVGFALLAGFVEEPGWRGVAIDGFARRSTVLRAALVIGMAHALWHLPLFLVEGSYQHGLGTGLGLVRYSLALLPLSVLLVWLCVRGRLSILVAVVAHAIGNMAGELVPSSGRSEWVGLAVGVAAAVVAWAGLRDERL